jgi:protein TonB
VNLKSFSTLQIALGVSVIAARGAADRPHRRPRGLQPRLPGHAAGSGAGQRPQQREARQGQAIAQASLAGGGEAEKGPRHLAPAAFRADVLRRCDEDAQRKIETMQEQQMLMLAQMKNSWPPCRRPIPSSRPTTRRGQAREEKRRHLVKLLAEIERRINEENARPKKRYISPATREEVYAVYYDNCAGASRTAAPHNFPELAGRKLYGELTMIVTVNHDGRVLDTEVVETSGNLTLDRRAAEHRAGGRPLRQVQRRDAPRADQIVVVSRFKFTRDDTLETKLTSR